MGNEEKGRIEQLEYYISLLLMTFDQSQFPFFFLVMSHHVKREEVQALLHTCEKLSERLDMEIGEGLLLYDAIFEEFQLAMPSSLEVKETIDALEKQGLYRQLMIELRKYA